MRFKRSSALFAGIVLCANTMWIMAHHSLTAEFNLEKRVTLTGVITSVEWMNPHAWFHVDVKEPKAVKISKWAFQLRSPTAMTKLGWTQHTLRIGDVITVFGSPSIDGTKAAFAREIMLPDGRKIVAEPLVPVEAAR